MANVEKANIAPTPEMLAVVREVVASGEYASSSEVVHEALRDWKLRRSLHQQEVDELHPLWNEGLDSGPSRFADMAEIKAEARQRLDKMQADE